MRNQRGISLIELVVVLGVVAVIVAVTAVYSASWMARETLRSAAYDVQGLMQLTRVEAVSRNHDCRFVIDTASGNLVVLDTMGTSTTDDDETLHVRALPLRVSIERPDLGDAVTLEYISGTESYQVVFTSSGMVSSGTGGVFLHGGDMFGNVAVHSAGAVQVSRWNGTGWLDGL